MNNRVIFRLQRFMEIDGKTVDLYEEIKSGRKTSEWRNASKYWLRILCSKMPNWMTMPLVFTEGAEITLDSLLKIKRAWFIVGFPKGNAPRLEAEITHLVYHARTHQLEIQIANVIEVSNELNAKSPIDLFLKAERFLRKSGFGREIHWCDNRPSIDELSDRQFLREYAWVVFNSGMKNSVIRAKWNELCKAFHYFNILKILDNKDEVRKDALNVFGNYKKVDSVIEVAQTISNSGFLTIRQKTKEGPLKFLSSLPYIGEVTKFHLARNLGFDYIKPDRHLVRLAAKFDMSPFDLCDVIHEKTGRRLGTIDVILWRFCEQKGQTKIAVGDFQ